MRGDSEVTFQSLNHCKEKEGKIRIHFWHPNVSSLNLSTSCCAMLPHVPNLFSASDGAARRSLSHSAQVLGGVRDRCRRRSDRFASGGVFYLAGSPDVGPTGPAVACLIPCPAGSQSVPSTTSTFSPPRQNSTGLQPVFHAMLVLFLSLISILG